MARETKLGNPALEKAVAETDDPDLKLVLQWSNAVNKSIAEMVRGVPPFPYVKECLELFARRADMIVCSQTPNMRAGGGVGRAWHRSLRDSHLRPGSRQQERIAANAKQYPPNHTLMIGDAPGDYNAAVANNCLFFPINPGVEEASWRRLHDEGIARFFEGTFAAQYQQQLLDEFDTFLPDAPHGRSKTDQ